MKIKSMPRHNNMTIGKMMVMLKPVSPVRPMIFLNMVEKLFYDIFIKNPHYFTLKRPVAFLLAFPKIRLVINRYSPEGNPFGILNWKEDTWFPLPFSSTFLESSILTAFPEIMITSVNLILPVFSGET